MFVITSSWHLHSFVGCSRAELDVRGAPRVEPVVPTQLWQRSVVKACFKRSEHYSNSDAKLLPELCRLHVYLYVKWCLGNGVCAYMRVWSEDAELWCLHVYVYVKALRDLLFSAEDEYITP